jgi:8-oxo-dGTP pyrophosphatase MutT (NUDIX family)
MNLPDPNRQRPDTNIPGQTPPKDMYAKRNVRGAGGLIIAKNTGRILFALRSAGPKRPEEWNLWGGKVSVDESPEHSVIRWAKDQTGYRKNFYVIPIYSFLNAFTNFRYYNFLLVVDNEFIPIIDRKFIRDYQWMDMDNAPTPLNSLVKTLLDRTGHKIKDIIEKNSIKEGLSKGHMIKLKDLIKNIIY